MDPHDARGQEHQRALKVHGFGAPAPNLRTWTPRALPQGYDTHAGRPPPHALAKPLPGAIRLQRKSRGSNCSGVNKAPSGRGRAGEHPNALRTIPGSPSPRRSADGRGVCIPWRLYPRESASPEVRIPGSVSPGVCIPGSVGDRVKPRISGEGREREPSVKHAERAGRPAVKNAA